MTGTTAQSFGILAHSLWDAVVIGAGPAGAIAARELARTGLQTLLLDAKRFPRPKVCGGCLNRRGLATLEAAGLEHVVGSGDGRLHSFRWHVGANRASFALPDMRVIERSTFDAALANEAVRAGAMFLDGVPSLISPCTADVDSRQVVLSQHGTHVDIAARVVICADGLGRSSLKKLNEFRTHVRNDSRIGVGATLPANSLPADEITMVVGPHGYVGLAESRENRVNIAAALAPRLMAQTSIATAIRDMLQRADVQLAVDWSSIDWQGTPPLTSRPASVAGHRLMVIGDASGYVEPFSGEGMATALATGLAVAPLAAEAARAWLPELAMQWEMIHRQLVFESQATCRQLAWLLRQPWAAGLALRVCRAQPWVAHRFIRKVS